MPLSMLDHRLMLLLFPPSLGASAVAHWHQQNPCHDREARFQKHGANARMNQQMVPTLT